MYDVVTDVVTDVDVVTGNGDMIHIALYRGPGSLTYLCRRYP